MLPASATACFAEAGVLISRSRNSKSQPARVRAASKASIAASYGALSGHSAGAGFCLAGAWAMSGETARAAANVIRRLAILCAELVLVLLLNSSFMVVCDVSWGGWPVIGLAVTVSSPALCWSGD